MKNVKKLLVGLLITMGVVVGCAGCGSREVEPKEEVKVEQQEEVKEEVEEVVKEKNNLKVGDVFETEKATVKINKIKTTKERNQYSDVKADKVVVIEYTYENKNNETMYLDEYYFKAYDKDGEILEHYGYIDYKYPQEISKGKKCTAEVVFALNNKSNDITLELQETMFGGDILATWDLTIK